jgi:hypothetical protein
MDTRIINTTMAWHNWSRPSGGGKNGVNFKGLDKNLCADEKHLAYVET